MDGCLFAWLVEERGDDDITKTAPFFFFESLVNSAISVLQLGWMALGKYEERRKKNSDKGRHKQPERRAWPRL